MGPGEPALPVQERGHLERCIELAEQGLAAGDEPFGSVLVGADGSRLAEGRNRVVATGDQTQHPEIELARWAAQHLSPAERARATVFTSGEHCPMCAAAHAWVGLGRIVYAHSSEQLAQWLDELGAAPPPRTHPPGARGGPRRTGAGSGHGSRPADAGAAPAFPAAGLRRATPRTAHHASGAVAPQAIETVSIACGVLLARRR